MGPWEDYMVTCGDLWCGARSCLRRPKVDASLVSVNTCEHQTLDIPRVEMGGTSHQRLKQPSVGWSVGWFVRSLVGNSRPLQDYFALKREKNKPLSRESIKVGNAGASLNQNSCSRRGIRTEVR